MCVVVERKRKQEKQEKRKDMPHLDGVFKRMARRMKASIMQRNEKKQ